MAEADLTRHNGYGALGALRELADLYERVYAEPPYNSAPKFSRPRFERRIRDQATMPEFTLVTARREGVLVGYTFGFPLPPGAWWVAASRPDDTEVMGSSKFGVIELMVDKPHRGKGIGRALLTTLLDGRPERYATLAAVIKADAYAWYLRNGWRKTAEFRVEPPFADALLLNLDNP